MTVTCPKGHTSSEPDFCSECGARISAIPAPVGPDASGVCPDCGTPRVAGGGSFCELCGYNFDTAAHGEIPLAPQAPPVAPQPKWTVLVTVDASLKEPESPDPPPGWKPISIPADRSTLLIGRSSQSRGGAPDIPLDFDEAVSHRHCLLTFSNGSDWSVRDIGSSNGTRVNGKELTAMVDVPLQPGDRITLGHWTCLTLSREVQP